jgi:hypothetical protein
VKTISLLAATALLFLVPIPSRAQDIDIEGMRKALQELRVRQKQTAAAMRARFVRDLMAATESDTAAVNFYEDAVRATQFAGQNRESGQFREWRKREEAHLKNSVFRTALRMHLNYLAISIERAGGREMKEILPSLLNYINTWSPVLGQLRGEKDWVMAPVNGSIFAKWYQAGDMLGGLKDWELVPGNIGGMYDKSIIPEMRRQKDPRLLTVWDERIQRESAAASGAQLQIESARFNEIRLPALQWERAQDMLLLGDRAKALNEMFGVIKQHPGHSQAETWLAALEALLNGNPAAEASPAPDSSPTPGT